jgi:hypothetical protein
MTPNASHLSVAVNNTQQTPDNQLFSDEQKKQGFMDFLKDLFSQKGITKDKKQAQIMAEAAKTFGLSPTQIDMLNKMSESDFKTDDYAAVARLLAGGTGALQNLAGMDETQQAQAAVFLGLPAEKLQKLLSLLQSNLADFSEGQLKSLGDIMSVFKNVEIDKLKSDDIGEVRAEGNRLRDEYDDLKHDVADAEWIVNPINRARYMKLGLKRKLMLRRFKAQNNWVLLRSFFHMSRKEMRNADPALLAGKFTTFKSEYGPEAAKSEKVMSIRLQMEEIYSTVEQAYKFRIAQKQTQLNPWNDQGLAYVSNAAKQQATYNRAA